MDNMLVDDIEDGMVEEANGGCFLTMKSFINLRYTYKL